MKVWEKENVEIILDQERAWSGITYSWNGKIYSL